MPIFHDEDEASDSNDDDSQDNKSTGDDDENDSLENEKILKPVFVRKENRLTMNEKEKKMNNEKQNYEKKKIVLDDRQNQTRILVAESIKKMEEINNMNFDDMNSDHGLPDDHDDLNDDDDLQYEEWKVRELKRLKRDTEEREVDMIEKTQLLHRRNMTDEERYQEDERLGIYQTKKEKVKWNFMQKYHHKGVFYMDSTSIKKDSNDVRVKNYAAQPTLEDNVDKEKLPTILQVKNFGKRGRTKYTHLVDQDTTYDSKKHQQHMMKIKPNESLMNKYLDKRSGVGKI